MPRLSRRTAVLTALVVLLIVAAALWYGVFAPDAARRDEPPPLVLRPDPPEPDPREVFPTPFRNVKAGVAYVGDAACAACHREIARTYHAHPMGRSAEWTDRAPPVERYDAAAKNPFSTVGFQFRVDNDGKRMTHWVSAQSPGDVPLPKYAASADVAIGSGTRGRAYLTIDNGAGAVWQSVTISATGAASSCGRSIGGWSPIRASGR